MIHDELDTSDASTVALENPIVNSEPMAIEEIAKREVQQCGCICFYPAT